jgi:hypothetical protein
MFSVGTLRIVEAKPVGWIVPTISMSFFALILNLLNYFLTGRVLAILIKDRETLKKNVLALWLLTLVIGLMILALQIYLGQVAFHINPSVKPLAMLIYGVLQLWISVKFLTLALNRKKVKVIAYCGTSDGVDVLKEIVEKFEFGIIATTHELFLKAHASYVAETYLLYELDVDEVILVLAFLKLDSPKIVYLYDSPEPPYFAEDILAMNLGEISFRRVSDFEISLFFRSHRYSF